MIIYSKGYLFALGLSAILYGGNSFASIRCEGQLLDVGDSQYAVEAACGMPDHVSVVQNGTYGSELYAYYNKDGQTIEIHYIDAHVYTIGGDENRH